MEPQTHSLLSVISRNTPFPSCREYAIFSPGRASDSKKLQSMIGLRASLLSFEIRSLLVEFAEASGELEFSCVLIRCDARGILSIRGDSVWADLLELSPFSSRSYSAR